MVVKVNKQLLRVVKLSCTIWTVDFVTWVEAELRRRQWRAADLARHGKLTTAQISRVLNRQQNAGHAFCEGLARAFDLPKDVVYAKAGLGNPDPQPDQWARTMSYRLNRPPPELRDVAESIIEALIKKERQ